MTLAVTRRPARTRACMQRDLGLKSASEVARLLGVCDASKNESGDFWTLSTLQLTDYVADLCVDIFSSDSQRGTHRTAILRTEKCRHVTTSEC